MAGESKVAIAELLSDGVSGKGLYGRTWGGWRVKEGRGRLLFRWLAMMPERVDSGGVGPYSIPTFFFLFLEREREGGRGGEFVRRDLLRTPPVPERGGFGGFSERAAVARSGAREM